MQLQKGRLQHRLDSSLFFVKKPTNSYNIVSAGKGIPKSQPLTSLKHLEYMKDCLDRRSYWYTKLQKGNLKNRFSLGLGTSYCWLNVDQRWTGPVDDTWLVSGLVAVICLHCPNYGTIWGLYQALSEAPFGFKTNTPKWGGTCGFRYIWRRLGQCQHRAFLKPFPGRSILCGTKLDW